MTVQEQAFRAYYASLTDAELLKIVANRGSFIEIAQRTLLWELQRRQLEPPEALESTHEAAKTGKK